MPLFEEDENKWFVEEVLMQWMKYESFIDMMRDKVRKLKNGKSDNSSSIYRK